MNMQLLDRESGLTGVFEYFGCGCVVHNILSIPRTQEVPSSSPGTKKYGSANSLNIYRNKKCLKQILSHINPIDFIPSYPSKIHLLPKHVMKKK
jgi:hypothetical protein